MRCFCTIMRDKHTRLKLANINITLFFRGSAEIRGVFLTTNNFTLALLYSGCESTRVGRICFRAVIDKTDVWWFNRWWIVLIAAHTRHRSQYWLSSHVSESNWETWPFCTFLKKTGSAYVKTNRAFSNLHRRRVHRWRPSLQANVVSPFEIVKQESGKFNYIVSISTKIIIICYIIYLCILH